MTNRYAKLAILIALLALCAFVLDVLSPATPTPTAQIMVRSIELVSLSLVASLLRSLIKHEEFATIPHSDTWASRPSSRLRRALICILIC